MGTAVADANVVAAAINGDDGKKAWARLWLMEMLPVLLLEAVTGRSMVVAVGGGNLADDAVIGSDGKKAWGQLWLVEVLPLLLWAA